MPIGIIPMAKGEEFPVGIKYGDNDLEIGDSIVAVDDVVITPPSGLKKQGNPVISDDGRDVSHMVLSELANTDFLVVFHVRTLKGHKYHNPDIDACMVRVR